VQRYILGRLAQVLPMVLLISVVLFFAMRLVPGGPLAVYARGGVTPEALAALREKLGLDRPLIEQFLAWLGPALQGDLGYSYVTNRPVLDEVVARLGPTFYLMGMTFLVVLVLAVLLGTLQAVRQYSKLDIALTTVSFAGAAMPVYWLAMILIIINAAIRDPSTGRPFLPTGGLATPGAPLSAGDLAAHLVLPMLALGLGWVSWYARYVRSSMLDVVHAEYIRTARAKGVRERTVIFKHAFKNASLPLVTLVALDLPYLFAGALFTEFIFGWPGMGNYFYFAIIRRDYPVVMGLTVIVAILVMVGNLLADVAYAYLDPRVRYEGKRR
jgi:peptide/nickel transport system permease protein